MVAGKEGGFVAGFFVDYGSVRVCRYNVGCRKRMNLGIVVRFHTEYLSKPRISSIHVPITPYISDSFF